MRAGSLSREPVFSILRNRFICGYRDISAESYAGNSGTHAPDGNAVETTNGAGPHNLQLFILNAEGVVLHCLAGYWSAPDLATELSLAERLNYLWQDHSLSQEQKYAQFRKLQLEHIRYHSREMVERSQMQSFDKKFELSRQHPSDTLYANTWNYERDESFKTTDVIMHERMSQRPFLSYTNFDVARFSDYGTPFYDKHEDALDESGQWIDSDVLVVPIKNNQRFRQAYALKTPHVPKIQVKTYGTLRKLIQ